MPGNNQTSKSSTKKFPKEPTMFNLIEYKRNRAKA